MNIKSLIKIAFRNLFRKKRRAIFNIITLTLSIGSILMYVNIMRGSYYDSFRRIINMETGHIQLHQKDYLKEERRLPLNKNIKNIDLLSSEIKNLSSVVAVGKRVKFWAIISNSKEIRNVMGLGVDPEEETHIGIIHKTIKEGGRFLQDGEDGIVIGKGLADMLGFQLNSNVKIYSQTVSGENNILNLRIVGIFDTGFSELDKNVIYIPLILAQDFLSINGECNEVIVRLTDMDKVSATMTQIEDILKNNNSTNIEVKDWKYFAEDVISAATQDLVTMIIVLFVMIFLATFGIINTMSMTVVERFNEIGTMRAIGVKKKEIAIIFLMESVFIGLVGVIIGWLIGGIFCYYLMTSGIQIPEETRKMITIPMADRILGEADWVDFYGTFALGMIASIIGGISPAIRASKLKITDALKDSK